MGTLGLRASQRRQLQQQLHRTQEAAVYRRLVAILDVDHGTPVREVARLLHVSPQSIYNWIARLEPDTSRARDATGVALATVLADQARSGRPTVWTAAHVACLRHLLASAPEPWGYFANDWTVPLLQEQLRHTLGQRIAEDTIRRELARLGYVWKRGRYRLAPDPALEKKTVDSASPPALVAGTAAQRAVGRRRNRSVVVSAAAGRVGAARSAA